uniref:Transmembrane protein 179B n=1 Tax=Salvator merianae TaxID=96440 RepID=A0A8D0BVW5_SALMN
MAQLSWLLLAEVALNGAAFLCGIISASSLTVTQGEFGGRCILYGSVIYNGTLNLSSSSHVSVCYFVSAISILTAIFSFLAMLFIIYNNCFVDRQLTDIIWIKGLLGFVAGVIFFLLISACILRVGMDTLCGSILKSTAASSCQKAQHRQWAKPYNAEKFYDNLYTAEAAAWVNFFFWCLKAVLLVVKCVSKDSSWPLQSNQTGSDETSPIVGDRSESAYSQ